VGDDVFVRIIDNSADDFEAKYTYFTNITNVVGNVLSVNFPAPELMDVASTETRNRRVQKAEWVNGGFIKNFRIIQGSSGNVEQAIQVFYAKNFLVEGVEAKNPGSAAVRVSYSNNCVVRNIRVPESEAQGGQASKGRVITAWNCQNILFENIQGERFQGAGLFLESYCKNVVFKNVELRNTADYANLPRSANSLIYISQGSEIQFENLSVYGKGSGQLLVNVGGNVDFPAYSFNGLYLRTDSALANIAVSNICGGKFVDGFNGVNLDYSSLKRVSHTFTYQNSWTAHNPGPKPPKGVILQGFYYLNDTTGVGDIFLVRDGGGSVSIPSSSLSVNSRVSIPNIGIYGTNYQFNSPTSSARYSLYSTVVNPGTKITFEWVYLAADEDDSQCLLQVES